LLGIDKVAAVAVMQMEIKVFVEKSVADIAAKALPAPTQI